MRGGEPAKGAMEISLRTGGRYLFEGSEWDFDTLHRT